jgi:hypothetical protein
MGPYADGSYHMVEFGVGASPAPKLCSRCLDNGVRWRSPDSLEFTYCSCPKGEERKLKGAR